MISGPTAMYDNRLRAWTSGGVKLTAVTTAVREYIPKFDEDYWSKKKAEERGVDPQVILDEWRAKGEESRAKGNAIHAAIRRAFERGSGQVQQTLMDTRIPEIGQAMDAIKILGMRPAGVEQRIASPQLGLTGVVDFIGWVRGERAVVDWKSGKVEMSNRFRTLLPPLERLDDCKMSHYALQLGLYAEILQVEYGKEGLKRYVIELHEDDWVLHEAPDVSCEVALILAGIPVGE